jgi:DNA-binding response OmpR family regulator
VSSVTPLPRPDVLFLAPESLTAALGLSLRMSFTVSVTSTCETALEFLRRARLTLVVIDLDCETEAAQMCREARRINPYAAVLVTTASPAAVPDALMAGCDSVLLKPYPPNLFYGRVWRLLRAGNEPRQTHRTWSEMHCPSCKRGSAVSFEFASRGHAWYACLGCRHVWVAPARD